LRPSEVCSALHGPGISEFKTFEKKDFPSETFHGLKEKEEKQYGEYRTRRLVLEA
jgi:hypothetical protein